ncbi:hypothetical protein TNCT_85601 [Trichonephila clavata]|uniref:Uncharacterized protein n=1 Tax=Trichonephila clavata TaxID=2740835 RepID=A0A8X6KT27_TRICU|nr:hypothetical protein TNCT_85601 [Trichonephila clavata]
MDTADSEANIKKIATQKKILRKRARKALEKKLFSMLSSLFTQDADGEYVHEIKRRRQLKLLYTSKELTAAYALVKLGKTARFENTSEVSSSVTSAVSMCNGERNESGEDSLSCTSEGHNRHE